MGARPRSSALSDLSLTMSFYIGAAMAFLPCFLRRPDAALALPNGHDLLLLIGVFLAATSSGDPWIYPWIAALLG